MKHDNVIRLLPIVICLLVCSNGASATIEYLFNPLKWFLALLEDPIVSIPTPVQPVSIGKSSIDENTSQNPNVAESRSDMVQVFEKSVEKTTEKAFIKAITSGMRSTFRPTTDQGKVNPTENVAEFHSDLVQVFQKTVEKTTESAIIKAITSGMRSTFRPTTDQSNANPTETSFKFYSAVTDKEDFHTTNKVLDLTANGATTVSSKNNKESNITKEQEEDDDPYVGYFKYIRDNDADTCVSLLVCESFVNRYSILEPVEKMYTGQVVAFFENYSPNEINRDGWWYKNAAILGENSKSVPVCKQNFPKCSFETKDLLSKISFQKIVQ